MKTTGAERIGFLGFEIESKNQRGARISRKKSTHNKCIHEGAMNVPWS